MSNLPTKTMIKEWTKRKMWNALEKFDTTKKSQLMASLLGTELEIKSIEWDECVGKMRILYLDMIKGDSYYSNFRYESGEYMKTIVSKKFGELYKSERQELEEEFKKVLGNLERINSPKKMLEYLKACDLEYPVCESVKDEHTFAEIDVAVYKPWIQNQLTTVQE